MAKLGSVSSVMLIMLLAVRTISRFPGPRVNHFRTERVKQKRKKKKTKNQNKTKH